MKNNEIDVDDVTGNATFKGTIKVDEQASPRPKKKIKKWMWIVESNGFQDKTKGHYSGEEEYKLTNPLSAGHKFIQKIDSTEIEVEE